MPLFLIFYGPQPYHLLTRHTLTDSCPYLIGLFTTKQFTLVESHTHATVYFNTSLLLRQNIWNYLSTPDSKNLGPTWVCIFRLRIFGAAKKRGKLQRWESNRVSTLRFFILRVWERSLSKSFLIPVNQFETDRCDFLHLFHIHCLLLFFFFFFFFF